MIPSPTMKLATKRKTLSADAFTLRTAKRVPLLTTKEAGRLVGFSKDGHFLFERGTFTTRKP